MWGDCITGEPHFRSEFGCLLLLGSLRAPSYGLLWRPDTGAFPSPEDPESASLPGLSVMGAPCPPGLQPRGEPENGGLHSTMRKVDKTEGARAWKRQASYLLDLTMSLQNA